VVSLGENNKQEMNNRLRRPHQRTNQATVSKTIPRNQGRDSESGSKRLTKRHAKQRPVPELTRTRLRPPQAMHHALPTPLRKGPEAQEASKKPERADEASAPVQSLEPLQFASVCPRIRSPQPVLLRCTGPTHFPIHVGRSAAFPNHQPRVLSGRGARSHRDIHGGFA